MGYLRSESDLGNGGRGSSLARIHEHHGTTDKCAPTLRASLRVAARMFLGQVDGQTEQQRLHAAVLVTPPTVQRDFGDNLVLPGAELRPNVRTAGTPDKKRHFQGSSWGGKHRVLFSLFSGSQENRRPDR
ncbi:hypothetical protein AMECASPLE_025162 [Ameca splendens]|uniref:Uncharacterized protein n=1 Tax=Ameca splendens TaxID=208324 RepID=A0ABV0Z3D7_9TELE